MGSALAAALRDAGATVRGPLGRGADGAGAQLVLLCVPDREIAAASAAVAPGPFVGHLSASAPLSLLAPHPRFVMHPLISVVGAGAAFAGATCAVDGDSDEAFAVADFLVRLLHMRPRIVPAEQRALYHAAASAASNFLITVECLAERLAGGAGIDREALVPLVRSTVDNWAARGARAALTGPIARGDELTVARQRAAVGIAAPQLLPLWDALVTATRDIAPPPDTAS